MIRLLLIIGLLTSSAFAAVTDDFADSTLSKDLKIPQAYNLKMKDNKVGKTAMPEIVLPLYRDNLVETTLKGKNFEKPVSNLNYDYSDTSGAVVKLKPLNMISTNKKFASGDIVKFVVTEDVLYNNKLILAKNSYVSAVIENISPNARFGTPAHLVISRFKNENLADKTLDGEINRQGKNFSLWVYPLSYALTPFGGFALTFIRGGNVKIKPDDIIEIYYRPTRFRKGL